MKSNIIKKINNIKIKLHYDDSITQEFYVAGYTFNELKNYYLNQFFIYTKYNKKTNKEMQLMHKCILIEKIL